MLDFSDREKPGDSRIKLKAESTPAENLAELPKINGLYRHFKGNLYRIQSVSQTEDTLEYYVQYFPIDPLLKSKLLTKSVKDFLKSKKIGGSSIPEFTFVPECSETAIKKIFEKYALSNESFTSIKTKYSENHRFYHSWQRLLAIFETVEKLELKLSKEQVVALLYHDIIYVPGASKGANEQLSALYLKANYRELSISFDVDLASKYILDTIERNPSESGSALVIDLELSSLATSAIVYCALNELIWFENRHLLEGAKDPRKDFDTRRLKFLLALADRGPIFNELKHMEESARENLEGLRRAYLNKYEKN